MERVVNRKELLAVSWAKSPIFPARNTARMSSRRFWHVLHRVFAVKLWRKLQHHRNCAIFSTIRYVNMSSFIQSFQYWILGERNAVSHLVRQLCNSESIEAGRSWTAANASTGNPPLWGGFEQEYWWKTYSQPIEWYFCLSFPELRQDVVVLCCWYHTVPCFVYHVYLLSAKGEYTTPVGL